MVKTTRKQREALFKIFQRDFPSWITPTQRLKGHVCPECGYNDGAPVKVPSLQYRRFRKTVQPFFGDSCVMVPWQGMWLGIETDGYTHS